MRKVVIHSAGTYDHLKLEEQPDPQAGPGEVLIDVGAIGINFADCIVRMGLYASAKEYVGWPITPGFEISGTVAALGDGVEGLTAGTPVLALTRFGGYAERLVVPSAQVFPLPAGFAPEQAAGFPAVFLTAWFALYELCNPRPGGVVLVHSAAGGVGGALVQLAKARGLRAVGVVGGAHKVETARAHGADAVIDKSTEDLWAEARRHAPEGYDIVLDANGVETLKESYRALRPAGKLVIYGFHTMFSKGRGKPSWWKLAVGWLRTPRFNPLQMTQQNKSVLAFNLSYLFDRMDILQEAMEELYRLAQEGKVTPPPVTTYPLADVARAHADIESGATVGKLVLIP
jgi:NADPH:quinone reductase-like Zn-dependent oxidoreductase